MTLLRPAAACCAAVLFLLLATWPVHAQQKPRLTADAYGRWETPVAPTLSPDGRWLAYGIRRVNDENELRIRAVARDTLRVVPYGSQPLFSPDSRWLVWSVGVSEAERERLQARKEPVRSQAGLLDLTTGTARTIEAVQGRAFDATGRYLALQGYAPEAPEGKPEGRGADLRVLDLAAATELSFGNVAAFAWSETGSLLALALATGTDAGNGVQVYNAADGRVHGLDASGSAYRHLAWHHEAADLAVLRSAAPASSDSAAHHVIAWQGLDGNAPQRRMLDPAALPDTLEVVHHTAPRWSEDGRRILVGLRPVEADEAADTSQTAAADSSDAAADEEEPALPGVQIWHSTDLHIVPGQKARQARDARRTLPAVWLLEAERLAVVGADLEHGTALVEGWRQAVVRDATPYPWGAMFGRPYADVWAVDVDGGARERVLEQVRYHWTGATGRWLLSYDGADYWSYDLHNGTRRNITEALPAVFADTTYDTPTDQLPPHGLGGWMEGDAAVLLYDQYDVWRVAPDGTGGRRLTQGAAEQVVHRVAVLPDDDVPGLPVDEPLYLHLYGERTKQEGYARLMPDETVERLRLADERTYGLQKADSADVYLFGTQRFDDAPDYFAAGPDLADARQVTHINPFMDDYAWGHGELIDFVSEAGRPLQAALLYPAGYRAGQAVPMIVYTYELVSPMLHRFEVPSERDYYNFTAWTQQGYAVLLPDIVYRARDPGISALEAVRAAVAQVVAMGVADADRVGLIGHSWGGYQATFLPTRTDIFAASVAGAPLTDFVSFMGQIHWNGGVPELSHWETGQGRMEVPFWEDPDAHRRNSPIHKVHEMETPLLMAFGNEDGVVDWDQGTEFYNFARRAGKQMVLLVYEGEDHGFRQKANQVDYHRRILEWFGHYLKGEPAPDWIQRGIPVDEQEEEARRVAQPQHRP